MRDLGRSKITTRVQHLWQLIVEARTGNHDCQRCPIWHTKWTQTIVSEARAAETHVLEKPQPQRFAQTHARRSPAARRPLPAFDQSNMRFRRAHLALKDSWFINTVRWYVEALKLSNRAIRSTSQMLHTSRQTKGRHNYLRQSTALRLHAVYA